MKLYFAKGACSFAVRVLLHELKLSCEYESVNLATKKTHSGKDFFEINPKGAVPVLVTDNNEVITENVAIQTYLADKYEAYQLLPQVNDIKRYHVLEWFSYVGTDLHKSFGPLFNSAVPQEIKKSIFIPALKTKLNFANKHLTKNKFLVGNDYTLPDAYFFVILSWLPHFGIDISEWAALAQYQKILLNRESFKTALAEES